LSLVISFHLLAIVCGYETWGHAPDSFPSPVLLPISRPKNTRSPPSQRSGGVFLEGRKHPFYVRGHPSSPRLGPFVVTMSGFFRNLVVPLNPCILTFTADCFFPLCSLGGKCLQSDHERADFKGFVLGTFPNWSITFPALPAPCSGKLPPIRCEVFFF